MKRRVFPSQKSYCTFFFLNKHTFILFLAVLGLHCCAWVFSSCGEQRCSALASHCGGFSCCRARALGARASVVVAHRL